MQKLGWFGGVGDVSVIHHARGAKDEVIYYDIHLEGSVVKQPMSDEKREKFDEAI